MSLRTVSAQFFIRLWLILCEPERSPAAAG